MTSTKSPKGYRLASQYMSNPDLVRFIRKLMKDHTTWRLTHMGQEPPTAPLLRAAMDEAARRRITIEHPELS
jgi:hypothetical protein